MTRLLAVAATVVGAGALAAAAFVAGPAATEPADRSGAGPREATGPRARPTVDPQARRLLERAAVAPRTTAYTGTQYVSAWSSAVVTSRVVQVDHVPGGSTEPSLLGGGAVDLLARHYSLSVAGSAQVAGRAVDVVEARRPGQPASGRAVARFWLDRTTGLALRREVYRRDGSPSRASAFIDITVRAAAPRAAADRAWPDALDQRAVRALRHRGWTCPRALPGPLPLVDARRGHAGMLHLSYSDGLASVSLFQQRGRLDVRRLEGYRRAELGGQHVWARAELPWRVVWSDEDMVYTLVADAPQRTVEQAIDALAGQRRGLHVGRLGRLGRGLDRVASWFNPMD